MILPSDNIYRETKQIMLGKESLKTEFLPLVEWIDKTYGVKTINVFYDLFDNKTPHIQICFEYENEKNNFLTKKSLYINKIKQKAIGLKFSEIIKQQGLSKSIKTDSNNSLQKTKDLYLTDNVLVTYCAFETVAKLEAIYKITTKATEDFIKSFRNKDIWTISICFTIPTFFMFTEQKVKEYNKSEIISTWTDKFFEIVKAYDEFNYFKRNEIQVLIDSKENFDKKYNSNWYYYYK